MSTILGLACVAVTFIFVTCWKLLPPPPPAAAQLPSPRRNFVLSPACCGMIPAVPGATSVAPWKTEPPCAARCASSSNWSNVIACSIIFLLKEKRAGDMLPPARKIK